MNKILQNLLWAVLAVGSVVVLIAAGMIGLGATITLAFITPSWLLILIIALTIKRRYKKRLAKKL